jgi:hypothetical protein
MVAEIVHCMDTRGEPSVIRINPITKYSLESELRMRASFNNANAQKNARELAINRLCEVDSQGRVVPGGWEIPIEADDHVPMNHFWVGVGGYDISRENIGRKIPRGFLKFPGRN